MNSKSKYAANRKHRQPGWPRDTQAAQLKSFLGAQGCGTSQVQTFDELHQLAKIVFNVPGDADHRITAAQIDALGAKNRRWRASSYVLAIEPSARWPKVSRARGTLTGLDSKSQATGKLAKRQERTPSSVQKRLPFMWTPSLRYLRGWMIAKGVNPADEYTESQIMTLCWDIYQSTRDEVGHRTERPANLAALQRRLTGKGRKCRVRDRDLLPTHDYKLGTLGPASAVRRIPVSRSAATSV